MLYVLQNLNLVINNFVKYKPHSNLNINVQRKFGSHHIPFDMVISIICTSLLINIYTCMKVQHSRSRLDNRQKWRDSNLLYSTIFCMDHVVLHFINYRYVIWYYTILQACVCYYAISINIFVMYSGYINTAFDKLI